MSNKVFGDDFDKSQSSNSSNISNVSLENRRGIMTYDFNGLFVLVKAPIEQVGQAVCQMKQVTNWERDVYEREIEIVDRPSFLMFQLRKHSWTIISPFILLQNNIISLSEETAKSMSLWLHTTSIYFITSDVGCYIGYHLYNSGQSIERLYAEQGDYDLVIKFPNNRDEDEYRSENGVCQFRSHLRQLKAYQIQDPYAFTNKFLQEQDVLVIDFYLLNRFKGEKKYTVTSWLKRDDLERMDYIALSQACTDLT
ncbi:hypothetical protein F7734_07865 [Scytonema sp. UIC 10036]|uniref:hypothetical protein n=1 Tax=Scytonema sp. UIC 10036 TaxID=2304196 RepID=UPI0012DA0B0D|nr:hypothetical protein [Scytonema sp. UIC 10036]MUG92374.1 hypothetical protein [Scytonema sp. UIC 10036]